MLQLLDRPDFEHRDARRREPRGNRAGLVHVLGLDDEESTQLLLRLGKGADGGGDLAGALAHGRRAVELAEERGSVFSQVEAAAFLGTVELANADLAATTRGLERALALARHRRTALWYEPRILATLADAKRAAGDRSGARALLAEARESVERGQGWRLSACDVELARVRLLASEPVPDRTAIESALESVEALATELGADSYRRMAELERARLAETVTSRDHVLPHGSREVRPAGPPGAGT